MRGAVCLWPGIVAVVLAMAEAQAAVPVDADSSPETAFPTRPPVGNSRPVIELRLWNIPRKGSANPIHLARRRVFDAFCKRHPQIRVRALAPLKIEGPAAEGNEFLAVAGGVAPDVFYLYGRKIGDYRAQGFLFPLNDFLADDARQRGRTYAGINAPDSVWELCHDRGRIVCVPYLYYSMALMCRKDLFARAGLGDRVPRDWQDLYEMARKLTWDPSREPGADPYDTRQYGIEVLGGPFAGWHYLQYVWSAGGDVVQSYFRVGDARVPAPPPPVDYARFHVRLSNLASYELKRRAILEQLRRRSQPTDYSVDDLEWRLVTDSGAAMEALKFYRRLIHQPWLRHGDHEFDITPDMMQSGTAVDPVTGESFDLGSPEVRKRIYHGVARLKGVAGGRREIQRVETAMKIGVIEEVDDRSLGLIRAVPFPSRRGVAPAAFIAGHYLAINAAIRPERRPGRHDVEAIRRAAWKYILFVTGPEAQRIVVETFVEHGLEQFIRPALLEEAGYPDLLGRIPAPRRQLWTNLEQSARVEPYCDRFTHVMTRELSEPIEKVINDPPDPRTGLYRRDLPAVMGVVCRRVNSKILGTMSDLELRRRSRVGWVVFVVIAAGLVGAACWVTRLALSAQRRSRDDEGFGAGGHPGRRRAYAWIFLAPAVGTILIWAYYPLAKGLVMAFQDYRILGGSTYVGLRNFIDAVYQATFWRSLLQTAQYVVLLVGLGFCAPIILALLLTEIPRGKVLYRVIYYLPAVTTGLVTLFLWKDLLYDPSGGGALNRIGLALNGWPVGVVVAARLVALIGVLLMAAGLARQAGSVINEPRERWITGVVAAVSLALVGWALTDGRPLWLWMLSVAALAGASGLAVRWWRPAAAVVVPIVGFLVLVGSAARWQGLVDALFGPFRFEPQKFLRDPDTALFWCVIPVIWAGAGPGCLIYLAALKGIPEEQYEASEIDGAGVWKKFWNVTFPNLHALIIINFIGAVIAAFKESSNIFVMTGGGPENRTMTIGLEIWYNAFFFLNFGGATAMGWIMGALLIGFTLHQLRILNRLQFRSAAVEEETANAAA